MRRIIGKTISTFVKEEIDGYSAGAEATKYIHAMAQIFDDDGTDGILLVDCNIQITCREMSISSTRTEFFEIVLLWRGRDLIPGRGNTG